MLRLLCASEQIGWAFHEGENFSLFGSPPCFLYTQGYRHIVYFLHHTLHFRDLEIQRFPFQEYFWFPWELYPLPQEPSRFSVLPSYLSYLLSCGHGQQWSAHLAWCSTLCLLGDKRVTELCSGLWTSGRGGGIDFFITCLYGTWQIRYSVGDY